MSNSSVNRSSSNLRTGLGALIGVVIGGMSVYFYDYERTNCPNPNEHHIALSTAKPMIDAYYNSPTYKLMATATEKLQGWRIDRCDLDYVFDKHSFADAIQLYIAQREDNTHTLVWVASGVDGNGKRVDLTDQETIMDMVSGCPTNCPDTSPLKN